MEAIKQLLQKKARARVVVSIVSCVNVLSPPFSARKDDVLYVCCHRGKKDYRTRISIADADGTAQFNQVLSINVTLYFRGGATRYSAKIFELTLVSETSSVSTLIDFGTLLKTKPSTGGLRRTDLRNPAYEVNRISELYLADSEIANQNCLRAAEDTAAR